LIKYIIVICLICNLYTDISNLFLRFHQKLIIDIDNEIADLIKTNYILKAKRMELPDKFKHIEIVPLVNQNTINEELHSLTQYKDSFLNKRTDLLSKYD